ncbi:MAG: hypothetical protein JW780_00770 [Clostridiales bacterium]|nr:hypothetical protein [Clostridiales bacterium]
MHRIVKGIIVSLLLIGVLYLYMSTYSPVDSYLSEYFIRSSFEDTGASNAVAAIYLNYRMFDSLFETLMLMVSVVAVIHLSWRNKLEPE